MHTYHHKARLLGVKSSPSAAFDRCAHAGQFLTECLTPVVPKQVSGCHYAQLVVMTAG